MTDKITIAIDAMGGENAPYKNLEGINLFLENNKKVDDFLFQVYGDEDKINQVITEKKYP